MADLLFTNLWVGPLLCFALWLSDYELTVVVARLYKAQDKVVFQGSYELNPLTQRDVDALRWIGFRILFKPLYIASFVAVLGAIFKSTNGRASLYALGLGMFVLVQLAIHVRHFQSWYSFRRVIPTAKGRIEYPRGGMLRSSALQLVLFAVLFLVLYVVTGSLFILGGAAMCCVNAMIHYRLALKHDASQTKAA